MKDKHKMILGYIGIAIFVIVWVYIFVEKFVN